MCPDKPLKNKDSWRNGILEALIGQVLELNFIKDGAHHFTINRFEIFDGFPIAMI
jgi:hypothetical protein